MADEPGPYATRDPMPLRPRVTVPFEFEGIGARAYAQLAGVDPGLGGAAGVLLPFQGQTLDAAYNTDIAPVVVGLGELGAPGDAAHLNALNARADEAIGDLAARAAELPGANENSPGDDSPTTPDPGDNPGRD